MIQHIKDVLSFLPQNCEEDPEALDYTPGDEQRPALDAVVPESAQQPYDIREVVNRPVTQGRSQKFKRTTPRTSSAALHA